jgi:hypothetical protein
VFHTFFHFSLFLFFFSLIFISFTFLFFFSLVFISFHFLIHLTSISFYRYCTGIFIFLYFRFQFLSACTCTLILSFYVLLLPFHSHFVNIILLVLRSYFPIFGICTRYKYYLPGIDFSAHILLVVHCRNFRVRDIFIATPSCDLYAGKVGIIFHRECLGYHFEICKTTRLAEVL